MINYAQDIDTYFVTPTSAMPDNNLGWTKERTKTYFSTHAPEVGDLVIIHTGDRRYALTRITMITQGKRRRIVTNVKPLYGERDWLFSGLNNWGNPGCRLMPASKENLNSILLGHEKEVSVSWNNGKALISAVAAIAAVESEAASILQRYGRKCCVTENGKRLRIHLYRERKNGILKREKIISLNGGPIVCEICGFSFRSTYGLGEDFIEAHHRVPLCKTNTVRVTTVDGISLLCSNCHRAIHIITPETNVEEMAAKFRKSHMDRGPIATL